jgi:hypothetical protein
MKHNIEMPKNIPVVGSTLDSRGADNGAPSQRYPIPLVTSSHPHHEPISTSKIVPCSKRLFQLKRERSIYERFKDAILLDSIVDGDHLPMVGTVAPFCQDRPTPTALNQSDLSTMPHLPEQDNPCTECWW